MNDNQKAMITKKISISLAKMNNDPLYKLYRAFHNASKSCMKHLKRR